MLSVLHISDKICGLLNEAWIVYWQVALKGVKLTCYAEYTCWWYTIYHKLYGIIGPVVRNPVVKIGLHCHAGGLLRVFEKVCWSLLTRHHQCDELSHLPSFSPPSQHGGAMPQVIPPQGARKRSPACCKAPRTCQACVDGQLAVHGLVLQQLHSPLLPAVG